MIATSLSSRIGRPLLQTCFAITLAFGLIFSLWVATIPVAAAKLMSAEEMIGAGLPPGVVVKTAGKPEFLTAVCTAVRTHRESGAGIAKAAVTAHQEYAGEIVATAVRCTGGQTSNCELTGAIVAAAIAASPRSAAAIDDAAMATAPQCADSVQTKTETVDIRQVLHGKGTLEDIPQEGPELTAPAVVPFATGGVAGFSPDDSFVHVCDNGQQRRIPQSRLRAFLKNHPGSYVGRCDVTPSSSR
jgi:hypothetical protein